MRAIGREAGVADGALYNHFADPAAMIVGICHEDVLSAMFPPGAASGPPTIESVVTAVLGGIA